MTPFINLNSTETAYYCVNDEIWSNIRLKFARPEVVHVETKGPSKNIAIKFCSFASSRQYKCADHQAEKCANF